MWCGCGTRTHTSGYPFLDPRAEGACAANYTKPQGSRRFPSTSPPSPEADGEQAQRSFEPPWKWHASGVSLTVAVEMSGVEPESCWLPSWGSANSRDLLIPSIRLRISARSLVPQVCKGGSFPLDTVRCDPPCPVTVLVRTSSDRCWPGRTRTSNLRINNPLHCLLCYGP